MGDGCSQRREGAKKENERREDRSLPVDHLTSLSHRLSITPLPPSPSNILDEEDGPYDWLLACFSNWAASLGADMPAVSAHRMPSSTVMSTGRTASRGTTKQYPPTCELHWT